jgi:GAF domain-containing protein
MPQAVHIPSSSQAPIYPSLGRQLQSLLEGERDWVTNAANFCALLYQALPDLNWAGIYILRGNDLVLGPFQGKPACVRIPVAPVARGVCGVAASERRTVVVKDVHSFPGHIACDSASNSEIVVPLIKHGVLWGVLDLDSPVPARFDDADAAGLEELAATFLAMTDIPR